MLVDSTPPTISGVKEISASLGKSVSYKSGITVSDNCSADVTFSVDNSQADLSKEGSYPIIYIAVDAVGNKTEVETTLHVYKTEITQDMLYKKLDQVISQIITSDMDREEQCRAIYRYVYQHVKYVSDSDKSDWVRAAFRGIDEGQGDCYTYSALSKAFFERLGIENMCIQRTSHHMR